ncbi:MAG: metal-dependent hydrolase [Tissierellia bacterium]|jgi:L-ascorbate metabolism protein UlaG (beta-lactamase superfamily)|nr:metal-dependent hydrolase [Tissierellia bacterium]
MKLIYLGHSAFYIESGDFKALIDPFIQGNPQCPFELDDFPQLSHILVTHGHADHIGDTVALAQKTGALVVCNHELGHYFQGQGLKNVHTMHIGGRFDRFKMTPAWHGSSVEIDGKLYDGGTPAGFLIDLDGIKIYHAGDTGLTMEMQLLQSEKIDYALLPIGSNYTMDWPDVLRAVEMIQPKTLIPMHYNTFEAIKVDFDQLAIPEKLNMKMLRPGETLDL